MESRARRSDSSVMRRVLPLLALSPLLLAQEPFLASVARQQSAVARQREAARKQARHAAARTTPSGFFAIPWPEPPGRQSSFVATAQLCLPLPPRELLPLVRSASRRSSLPEALLRSIVQQESAGNPCAVSPKGALGLMQLMPETAAQLGVEDPLNPEANLAAGSLFLQQLLGRYAGDLTLALAAYNAGPRRVDRAGGIPDIPETRDYVRNVLRRMSETALASLSGIQPSP